MPTTEQLLRQIKTLVPLPEWVAAWEAQGRTRANAVDAYLASAWAARGIAIRADAVTAAPLRLYNAKDEEIKKHPLLELLATVNPEWNKADLWRFTESALCVYNSAFWQKVKTEGGGAPKELFFLNPSTITIDVGLDPNATTGSSSGIQGFKQNKGNNKFERDEVVYFRGAYDPNNDLIGLALMSFAALAAVSENNADKYLSAFFANGAVPPLVFASEQNVPDAEVNRWIGWWRKLFGGTGNQHRTGFVGGGLKPIQLGQNLKDLALPDVRSSIHQSICVTLGVPELLLSPSGAADRTPIKLAEEILYKTTIKPRWVYYEETLNSELLVDFPDLVQEDCYLKFDTSKIPAMQEDKDAMVTRSVKMWEKRMLTLDQALKMAGEAPIGGAEGASRYVQALIRDQQLLSRLGELTTMPEGAPAGGLPGPAKMVKELNQWKKRALRLGAKCKFEADQLPPEVVAKISAGLHTAEGPDAIKAVFNAAHEEIGVDAAYVLEGIREGVEALRAAVHDE